MKYKKYSELAEAAGLIFPLPKLPSCLFLSEIIAKVALHFQLSSEKKDKGTNLGEGED